MKIALCNSVFEICGRIIVKKKTKEKKENCERALAALEELKYNKSEKLQE